MAEEDMSVRSAILEAINSLRGRRVRPDKVRIAEVVSKNPKLTVTREEILKELSEAVEEDAVIKVKYKDGYSYRNPSRMNRNQVASNDEQLLDVQRSLTEILKKRAESGDASSFSMSYILERIETKNATHGIEVILEDLMEEEVAAGESLTCKSLSILYR